MSSPSPTSHSVDPQPLPFPTGKANPWFRLLFAMAVPVLFLLAGLSLTR